MTGSPIRHWGRVSGLFCGLLTLAVIALPASAAKQPAAGPLFEDWSKRINGVVEQESPNFFFPPCSGNPLNEGCDPSTWVTNRTGRVWDVDDWWNRRASDFVIAARSSVSDTVGIVADGFNNYSGDDKRVAARVTAFTPDLDVTVTSSTGFRWTAVMVERDRAQGSNYFEYRVCFVEHEPGPYPVVPDSNGGTGILVDYTLTVSNPTGHKAQHVGALLQTYGVSAGPVAEICP